MKIKIEAKSQLKRKLKTKIYKGIIISLNNN